MRNGFTSSLSLWERERVRGNRGTILGSQRLLRQSPQATRYSASLPGECVLTTQTDAQNKDNSVDEIEKSHLASPFVEIFPIIGQPDQSISSPRQH